MTATISPTGFVSSGPPSSTSRLRRSVGSPHRRAFGSANATTGSASWRTSIESVKICCWALCLWILCCNGRNSSSPMTTSPRESPTGKPAMPSIRSPSASPTTRHGRLYDGGFGSHHVHGGFGGAAHRVGAPVACLPRAGSPLHGGLPARGRVPHPVLRNDRSVGQRGEAVDRAAGGVASHQHLLPGGRLLQSARG